MPNGTDVRFGTKDRTIEPVLTFGRWGVTETSTAFEVFQKALDHFDEKIVKKSYHNRVEVMQAAKRYYEGYHHKPLKIEKDQADDNVLINLCRPLIDDGASWLFGFPEAGQIQLQIARMEEEIREDVEPGEITEPDQAEIEDEREIFESVSDKLEAVYIRSGGFLFFKRMGVRGGIAGHVFLKIVPATPEQEAEGVAPKVVVLDPQLCSVWQDPADQDEVLGYLIEWVRKEKPKGKKKADYIYRQLAVSTKVFALDEEGNYATDENGDPIISEEPGWVVANFKAKKREKPDWELVGGPWAWNWAWSPILEAPNVVAPWGYYGASDLEDVAPLNDNINFVASNSSRIIKHHAHPTTVGLGFSAADLVASSVGGLWTINKAEASIQNLEMRGDLESSFGMLNMLVTNFWSIGRGFDVSTMKDRIGQITNFGLRVLAGRALNKMRDKRQTYGWLITELNRRLLDMLGIAGFDTIIKWPDPLPEDPSEKLARAQREIDMGVVSVETIAGELGRSWEEEGPKIMEEKKRKMELGQFIVSEFSKNAPFPNVADRARRAEFTRPGTDESEG